MEHKFPSNNTESIRFMSPSTNIAVKQPGVNLFSSAQEDKLLSMEQLSTDKQRGANIHQQSNQPLLQNMQRFQQENILHQNQQIHQITIQQNPTVQQQNIVQKQQLNPRFSTNEDYIKSQTIPTRNSQRPNDYFQNNQRNPRLPFEGQKIQMAPRVTGPQQLPRPHFSDPNGDISPTQPNWSRMEAPRPQNDQVRQNLQFFSNPENHNTQLSKNPPLNLTRKSSVLDVKPPGILNIDPAPNEVAIKSEMRTPSPGISNLEKTESKPDVLSVQAPRVKETETKFLISKSEDLSAEKDSSKKIDVKKTENPQNTETITKEKPQRVSESINSDIKDSIIIGGTVQKNIKFFEENDTAKKPLTPFTRISMAKRTEKIKSLLSNVIKSETYKNEYDSGVDETPVIHPNLGSIFQVPRKVAKIPYLRSKKHLRKSKSEKGFKLKRPFEDSSNKRQLQRSIYLKDMLTPSKFLLHHKFSNSKNQTFKSYGSKEELLIFFENTKSWRKLSRCGSKADQNKEVNKPTTNGDIPTPKKTPSKLQTSSKKNPPLSPTKTPLKSPGTPGTPGMKSLPKTPESTAPSTPLIKKVPMNKIQVGAAPSPNLKTVKSKVGSLMNTTHKPGGGNIKIETHKIDLSKVQPRTEAKNDQYKPSGGDKKIQQVKLQWNAKSKVGSMENATYKPGGGDKKIESVKLDFKDKAKPKVGSKDNVKHTPGGGNIKIENQKLEFKAQSKVGSLDNVKHKPGGGDIKIFDDKTYLRHVSGNSSEGRASGAQAFKEFSAVREVEGKSLPGTPGRNTSIKIRKMTSVNNSEESPVIKNVTEVTIASVTPKKEKKADRTPTEVKVTYSKISSLKHEKPENSVTLITVPAKTDAPVLKPGLSKKDLSDGSETGKQFNGNEVKYDFDDTSPYNRNIADSKHIS